MSNPSTQPSTDPRRDEMASKLLVIALVAIFGFAMLGFVAAVMNAAARESAAPASSALPTETVPDEQARSNDDLVTRRRVALAEPEVSSTTQASALPVGGSTAPSPSPLAPSASPLPEDLRPPWSKPARRSSRSPASGRSRRVCSAGTSSRPWRRGASRATSVSSSTTASLMDSQPSWASSSILTCSGVIPSRSLARSAGVGWACSLPRTWRPRCGRCASTGPAW